RQPYTVQNYSLSTTPATLMKGLFLYHQSKLPINGDLVGSDNFCNFAVPQIPRLEKGSGAATWAAQ
ncbi:MAG: hypothetical protein SO365_04725, partial [Prevotella sp.]|nr:hypothetical protein [Prevotella sp.]